MQQSAAGVPNPGAAKFSDRKTTNVRLNEPLKSQAIAKAKADGLHLCEYIEKLITADLKV